MAEEQNIYIGQAGSDSTEGLEIVIPTNENQGSDDLGGGEDGGGLGEPSEAAANLAMVTAELTRVNTESKGLQDLVGRLLDMQQQGGEEQTSEEILSSFEEDPEEFIRNAVVNSTEYKDQQDAIEASKAEASLGRLGTLQPDYVEVLGGEGFGKFLVDNPIYQKVLTTANVDHDVDTVSNLIKLFKAETGAEGTTAPQKKGNPVGSSRAGGKSSGKVFSKQALGELMVSNPEKYQKLQGEISLAYKEGRVK